MKVAVVSDEPQLLHAKVSGEVRLEAFSTDNDPLHGHIGQPRSVIVDMSDVEMIDSYGVNWLLGVHRRLAQNNFHLVLLHLSPIVRRVLSILRLNLVFSVAESFDEAVQICKGGNA